MDRLAHSTRRRRSALALQATLCALVLLASLAAPAWPALAQTAPLWRGVYYNSTDLTGMPALVRNDPHINFDWGTGAPGPGVNADHFSVEWNTSLYFDGGNYVFSATADDGVRVWVDDQLLIDEWHAHLPRTYSATKYLGPGYHQVRVTYFERTGKAAVRVWWARGAATGAASGGAWRGEYYANTTLSGTPVVRHDAAINFDWGAGSPMPGVIPADEFSVRWTRDVYLRAGNYQFYATVDDGVRISVNGVPVIDQWIAQTRATHMGSYYLPTGTHQIRVEYFEATGDAVAIVTWSGSSSPAPPVPISIIVDDQDEGFIRGGPTDGWYGRQTGYDEHLYWTWNSTTADQNWAKWLPHVTAPGEYEVFVYIPERFSGATQARYVVALNGQQYSRTVDQSLYPGQWVSLGSYRFKGGPDEYVYLGDATGEAYATRYVAYDAIMLVQGGQAPAAASSAAPASASAAYVASRGCAIAPCLGFGRVWQGYSRVRQGMGCPLEMEKTVWMAEQPFTGGLVLWRHDVKGLYVLYSGGTWQFVSDSWTTAEAETDPTYVPPPGHYQPKRGIGKVWRTYPNVRSALGWATAEERGYWGSVQTYERGVMLWSPTRGIHVLYGDGRWERLN
jgi:hypothetical protein